MATEEEEEEEEEADVERLRLANESLARKLSEHEALVAKLERELAMARGEAKAK